MAVVCELGQWSLCGAEGCWSVRGMVVCVAIESATPVRSVPELLVGRWSSCVLGVCVCVFLLACASGEIIASSVSGRRLWGGSGS